MINLGTEIDEYSNTIVIECDTLGEYTRHYC